jgi:transcriptional regulator with XRE-family HTH domain
MPPTDSWPALGACLRDARHRTALTQQSIAQHLGISQPAYSQIERGHIRPRPALLVPLVQLLRLNLMEVAALAGYSLVEVVQALSQHVPVRLHPATEPLTLQQPDNPRTAHETSGSARVAVAGL